MTEGYKGLEGVTRADRGLQGLTGGYKEFQGVTSLPWLHEVTGGYKG